MHKNYLVTGGAGFIGSNFVHFLLDKEPGAVIVNLDALTYAGSLENLKDLSSLKDSSGNERHIFIQGDICNRELVDTLLRKYQLLTIVHFAAETHVDRSIIDPEKFIRTNILGTFTLLESARNYWLEELKEHTQNIDSFRFHHVSTDEVYGSLLLNEPAWTESTPYAPNSPYAASKAASDHLVRSYGHTYGLPYSITNCSNNYGPYQFPEKLIPLTILYGLKGEPLPVYGDGQQVRDWLYVMDHCEAIFTVLENGRPGQTFNIGGEAQPSNLKVVETICEILDELQPRSKNVPHKKLIQFVSDRPGHDRRYAMDIGKIWQELGWKPSRSFEEGLVNTVNWYLQNPEWVEAICHQQEYQHWIQKNYQQRS